MEVRIKAKRQCCNNLTCTWMQKLSNLLPFAPYNLQDHTVQTILSGECRQPIPISAQTLPWRRFFSTVLWFRNTLFSKRRGFLQSDIFNFTINSSLINNAETRSVHCFFPDRLCDSIPYDENPFSTHKTTRDGTRNGSNCYAYVEKLFSPIVNDLILFVNLEYSSKHLSGCRGAFSHICCSRRPFHCCSDHGFFARFLGTIR